MTNHSDVLGAHGSFRPRVLRDPGRGGPWTAHRAAWSGGLHVASGDVETVISGALADQPAPHGLLAKVRDLGLCLISVRRLEPEPDADEPGP